AHRAGQEVASSEACVPHESSSCIRGVALRWGECGRVSAAGRDAVKGVRRLSVLFGTLPQSARLLLCELPDLRQMLLHLRATQQISYELFSRTLSFVPAEKRLGHILSGRLGTDALDRPSANCKNGCLCSPRSHSFGGKYRGVTCTSRSNRAPRRSLVTSMSYRVWR